MPPVATDTNPLHQWKTLLARGTAVSNQPVSAPDESENATPFPVESTSTPSGTDSPPANLIGQGLSLEAVRTNCLLILTVLACGAALSWLRPVVVPFLIALALFYLLSPIRGWLTRRFDASDNMSLFGTGLIGLLVVIIVGVLVWACVAEVTRDADAYSRRFTDVMSGPGFEKIVSWIGFERDASSGRVVLISPDQARRFTRSAVEWSQALLTDTSLVLIFLLFMLLGGTNKRVQSGGLPDEMAIRVRRYLVEMFMFSVITGVLVAIILGLLGVRFWLSFGFLAFVFNFIPTIGPTVATLMPLPIVLLDDTLPMWAKVLAIALPAMVQATIGTVIQPRFQSNTQGLHPVASMSALIVFGMLWGLAGAVLAVPLTAVIKIAFERIPGGQPYANLLAGRLDGSDHDVGNKSVG